ncbi:MAG TPA: hypothetical protein VF223_19135 [Trebonia sp.]
MAVIPSKVPDVLAYLVSLFGSDPALGKATPPVAVHDGNAVTAAPGTLALWVGTDDIAPGANPMAAESQRSWAGPQQQSEAMIIYCIAQAWSGSSDGDERAAAYAIVAAVEELVRAETTGFGGNGVVANPGVTGGQLRQSSDQRGPQAQVLFQIVLTVL